MIMSGSKTKYYVSSSTFPMFDDSSRVNQYAAAMLDYTANSPIEHSEYIKGFYNSSRLRNYRGYLNWCEKNGFYSTFGKVNANFYTDAKLDNTEVGNAIKHLISLGKDDTFGVYRSKLSFFSEDFYIKYLATQQGIADKFYADGDLYYTIDYPTKSTIRATLEDGSFVEGQLPTGSINTRFIEISYSIIRKIVEEVTPPSEGGDASLEPEVVIRYETEYGFYHYQENTGNSILDNLIKNNNSKIEKSFFPPIPLRADTAWFTGNKAKKINEALKYLEIKDTNSDNKTGYDQLKTACSKMEKGSINDIDYITLLLGIHLNSDNNSDQKYLFEFFYNLYFNYALKVARPNPSVAKSLYAGSNYFKSFADYVLKGFTDSGYTDGYFTSFSLNASASNLNLTYSWGHVDYFESNGQFKPEAKIGDYGILGGSFKYSYENGSAPYTLTLFCHQTSQNRFRFILFTSLSLTNHVYAGKTINTTAWSAINAAASKKNTFIDFSADASKVDGNSVLIDLLNKLGLTTSASSRRSGVTFKYVDVTGEIDTPFIVPLEKNTFYEIGVPNQANIAPCSMFLIYNCWVKVKQKWYERGFFKWVALAVAVVVAIVAPYTAPYIGTFAAAAVQVAAITVAVVVGVSLAIDLLTKVLTSLLGDRIGGMIGGLLQSAWQAICAAAMWVSNFTGTLGLLVNPYLIGLRIGLAIGLTINNTDTLLQSGENFGSALGKGALLTGAQVGAGKLGVMAGEAAAGLGKVVSTGIQAATQVAFSTFVETYVKTDSFQTSLEKGLIYGAIVGVGSAIAKAFNPKFSIKGPNDKFELEGKTLGEQFNNLLVNNASAIIKNPNTYTNLLNCGIQEFWAHKLQNLENDYQEFNNSIKATNDMLDVLNAKFNSMITAEYVCKMQIMLNRFGTLLPEMAVEMTPDMFINLGLASGSDITKVVLGKTSSFVEDSLSMPGYIPYTLYYTQTDNTLTWDVI